MATSKLRGARWPIFIVLAVLLVGAAFAASTLEKGGLQEAIDTEVAKVAGFANGSFAKAIEGVDTSVVFSDNKAAEVRGQVRPRDPRRRHHGAHPAVRHRRHAHLLDR